MIKFFHKIAENKFYIETLYNFILIKPLQGLSQNIFLQFVEKRFFPQCTKIFSNMAYLLGSVLSLWQNGNFFATHNNFIGCSYSYLSNFLKVL